MYERVKDSADSMMMSIVVEVEECTSLTVISCLSAVQASTPSGSQPLTLRARHLPLPQGTALIRCPRSRAALLFKPLRAYVSFNRIRSRRQASKRTRPGQQNWQRNREIFGWKGTFSEAGVA